MNSCIKEIKNKQMESSKTRYIKLQSSTDRVSGSLAAPTFDLTSSSFLQNCRAAQLLSCGFTQLTPNVREGENTVILQTNDVSFVVPENLPDMNIGVEIAGVILGVSIPSPPAGTYTPLELAAQASLSITNGLANANGSFNFGVEIVVASHYPTQFSWKIMVPSPPAFQVLYFHPGDAVASVLGIQHDRRILYGQGVQAYPGPLITFPRQTPVNTIHRFNVPANNYDIDQLMAALNDADSPYPSLLDPTWAFEDDRVVVSTALQYPLLRVLSVVEDRGSRMAPILGFHGETVQERFFSEQRGDTQPGLFGLTSAFLHVRPVATGGCVTFSSTDKQSLEVSVMGQIPTSGTPYGQFVHHDFSKSGDSFLITYEDDRDLSRFQIRLRSHDGALLQLSHPGITLFLKVFLR
jgi:hypothetical protein